MSKKVKFHFGNSIYLVSQAGKAIIEQALSRMDAMREAQPKHFQAHMEIELYKIEFILKR
jgi:hypothetical protein